MWQKGWRSEAGRAALAPRSLPTGNIVKGTNGVYAMPLQDVTSRAMFTNSWPVGPHRGAGRPESNCYYRALTGYRGLRDRHEPAEIRRRNNICPEQIPHRMSEAVYDNDDFPVVLNKAPALADRGADFRAGALPFMMNVLADALSVSGMTHIDMPVTPERALQGIREASRR